jgi:hypothetical protein
VSENLTAALIGMTDEERTEVDAALAALRERGYQDIEEHGQLRPGVRIRHRGERYHEALEHGTGIVLAITEKPDSAWSRTYGTADIELITLSDTARFNSRLSQLAQYHVAVIGGDS